MKYKHIIFSIITLFSLDVVSDRMIEFSVTGNSKYKASGCLIMEISQLFHIMSDFLLHFR